MRRLSRGIRRLHASSRVPLALQEAPRIDKVQNLTSTCYANVEKSAAVVFPGVRGASIVAHMSDTYFCAMVLANNMLLVSVYLPDASKSDHLFQTAIDSVSACLNLARARHGVTRFVVIGDWNVCVNSTFGPADRDGVVGPY